MGSTPLAHTNIFYGLFLKSSVLIDKSRALRLSSVLPKLTFPCDLPVFVVVDGFFTLSEFKVWRHLCLHPVRNHIMIAKSFL
jgi:hypothetical protein